MDLRQHGGVPSAAIRGLHEEIIEGRHAGVSRKWFGSSTPLVSKQQSQPGDTSPTRRRGGVLGEIGSAKKPCESECGVAARGPPCDHGTAGRSASGGVPSDAIDGVTKRDQEHTTPERTESAA